MNDIPNITYFLGAGASANALPVINELPKRLDIFKSVLNSRLRNIGGPIIYSEKHFMDSGINLIADKLINDIDWAIEEISAHSTVDTLAKRLYLIRNKHDELIKLKKVLYIYFLFEQGYNFGEIRDNVNKEIPDKRYDSLIATTISNNIDDLSIPGNIKVITWNYDIQFEIAFQRYLLGQSFDEIQRRLQVLPTFKNSNFDYNKFSIVHLNGIINQVYDWASISMKEIKERASKLELLKTEYLGRICKIYNELGNDKLQYLTYSWEDPSNFHLTISEKNNIIQIAMEILRNTDILIVIGYSFPIFNRNIDKDLMKSLNKNVQRIYIQDTTEKVEDIKNIFINSFAKDIESFPGQLKTIISTVNYTNQFHIPAEMNL